MYGALQKSYIVGGSRFFILTIHFQYQYYEFYFCLLFLIYEEPCDNKTQNFG